MDVLDFDDMNEKLVEEGKEPAEGKQIMLGITKASLATNSFLSAASFQELSLIHIYAELIPKHIMKEDILGSINYCLNLEYGIGQDDDIEMCIRDRYFGM